MITLISIRFNTKYFLGRSCGYLRGKSVVKKVVVIISCEILSLNSIPIGGKVV